MADDLSAAPSGAPLGSTRTWQLRLIRPTNLTIATDPALPDLYRTRFEGAPPKVRVRGGVVAVEYGPRFRPANWGRQAAELTLNPSVGWRIEAPRGLEGLRADLRAIQLLGLEVQHATSKAEVTLARPVGTVLLRFGGASEVTIHRPTGTAARVQVTGGASRVSFDDQFYKAVGGEASWTTSDFDQATDRYDIDFSRGVRDLVVDTLEVQVARRSQRLLATVLFTDIVGSTERARAVGDQRWRELLDLHDEAARRLVDQEGGRLIKSTGDGILAVFDGPGRGIRCALALREELRDRGIEIRAGLHTGEVDLRGDDVGGIAVHLAARIMAAAGPGEVLVSRTVRDLVGGSDIALEDHGTHTLKGVGDPWQLFAAS
ncbi:MAG TPA: adenylate/guanylate cyclase domain-containing protein [Propionibacteriaceae bacterium]|nr:adenylate/guanylate cyclase domain-containing protein [Propionibacteriaceae bacterium]